MSSFCNQCAKALHLPTGDFAGVTTLADTKTEKYAGALCEGCGYTLVDHTGHCIDPNCLHKHGAPKHDADFMGSKAL